jgi:hypothetical protein
VGKQAGPRHYVSNQEKTAKGNKQVKKKKKKKRTPQRYHDDGQTTVIASFQQSVHLKPEAKHIQYVQQTRGISKESREPT